MKPKQSLKSLNKNVVTEVPVKFQFCKLYHTVLNAFSKTQDHEREVDNRTVELDMLRERRGNVHDELNTLDELRAKEAEDYKAGTAKKCPILW